MSDSDGSDVADLWAIPDATAAAPVSDERPKASIIGTTTGYGTRTGKRTRRELEVERFLANVDDDDDEEVTPEVVVVGKRPAGSRKRPESQDELEALGIGGASVPVPVAKPVVTGPAAAKSVALAQFEKFFEDADKVDDDEDDGPQPQPAAARGGKAGVSGRGGEAVAGDGKGKGAGAGASAEDDDDDEVTIEEEPLTILIRFSDRHTKKIKLKPNQSFQKAIDFVNTCPDGQELVAQRKRRLVLKFDGDPIPMNATPRSLDIEDGDVVDVS